MAFLYQKETEKITHPLLNKVLLYFTLLKILGQTLMIRFVEFGQILRSIRLFVFIKPKVLKYTENLRETPFFRG